MKADAAHIDALLESVLVDEREIIAPPEDLFRAIDGDEEEHDGAEDEEVGGGDPA